MANIVRKLTSAQAYPVYPTKELLPKSQLEVYQAVGDYLIDRSERFLPLEAGSFLIELSSGHQVAFEYARATNKPGQRNPYPQEVFE